MTNTTLEQQFTIDEVVAALTGSELERENGEMDFRESVQHAAEDVDPRTAESYCQALLEHLSENPSSLRELEALILLGLAHPKVLARHRIPLAQEGRRLALLLERAGRVQRAEALLETLSARVPGDKGLDRELASMMRRTGNADRLVERYLRRAEEAVAQGQPKVAISWLQEVLLLDRSRRDVARMIRDLRFQEEEARQKLRRRLRFALGFVLFAGAVAAVVLREEDLRGRYEAVTPAASGNLTSLQARFDQLDVLVSGHPLSLAMFEAGRERARLRTEILGLEAQADEAVRDTVDVRGQRLQAAEAARLRGRALAEQGSFTEARREFERALSGSVPDWQWRPRLEADIRAITDWQAAQEALAAKSASKEPKQ